MKRGCYNASKHEAGRADEPLCEVLVLWRSRHIDQLREIGQLGDERGCQVYVVGGAVRDLLLGHVTLDLDLAVEGDGITFARVVSVRYRAGLAVFERFATARLVFPDGLKSCRRSSLRRSKRTSTGGTSQSMP